MILERLGLNLLQKLNPETAHGMALKALRMGLAPKPGPVTSQRLQTTIAGLDLPNPVGLAAGFDKNATAISPLMQSGFGFIEVGAATPVAQPGNPKPRLFRLTEDQAAINRFGFNNDGADVIASRLACRPKGIPVGLNLGANKTSEDRAADFAKVLLTCGAYVDFVTVNVSSPNTERLRDLQGKAALSRLLSDVMEARATLAHKLPVFLKISPDLNKTELADIVDVAQRLTIDAIVATNTTLARDGLKSRHREEAGGLSGKPLFDKSTQMLASLFTMVGKEIPLIGVGGISSAEHAYEKIRAGASALQLYTAMVFGGLSMVEKIIKDLDVLLERDGFASVSDAVGRQHI